MTHRLRLATRDDLASVQKIVQAAYAHYIARIGREPGPMLDDYAALIDAGRVHVGMRDGVVQGILVLIPQNDAMLLDNVAVAPEAQGSGLGRLADRVRRAGGDQSGLRRDRSSTRTRR